MSRGQASVRAVTFSRPPVVWGLAVYRTFSRVIVDSFPKLFVAHTRLNRLRLSDNTRSVKAKQLDDGIGDTLVAVRATSGVYKRPRLRCRNYFVNPVMSGRMRRPQRLSHILRADRQMAKASTGGGKDRVADCGRDCGGCRLAKPNRRFRAWQEINLAFRYVAHPTP